MAVVSGTILDDGGAICNVKNSTFAGGAIGNGTVNDRPAIQAAINAAAATGAVVYLPPGNYLIDAALTGVPLSRNVLVGANRDSTRIFRGNSTNGPYTPGQVLNWQTVGFTNRREEFSCRIEELTLDSNNNTTTVHDVAVDIARLTLLQMRRVTIAGNGLAGSAASCIGLRLISMFDSQFEDIYITSCGGAGGFTPCVLLDTVLPPATGLELNNCQFFNLHIEPGPTDAILLFINGNSTNPIVDNCFYGLKTHGDPSSGRPNNTVVKLAQYAQRNAFFGNIIAMGNDAAQGQVECDGQRNTWYSPTMANGNGHPKYGFHFTSNAKGNTVLFADIITPNQYGTAVFAADAGSAHNKILFPNGQGLTIPPLVDAGTNLVWWDDLGNTLGTSLQRVGGVSSTSQAARNLAGSIQLNGGNSAATVSLNQELDLNYRLLLSLSGTSGTPAAGAKTIANVAKTTTSFTLTLGAAPGGVATVTYDWMIVR